MSDDFAIQAQVNTFTLANIGLETEARVSVFVSVSVSVLISVSDSFRKSFRETVAGKRDLLAC